jgi:hypothetical protein
MEKKELAKGILQAITQVLPVLADDAELADAGWRPSESGAGVSPASVLCQ